MSKSRKIVLILLIFILGLTYIGCVNHLYITCPSESNAISQVTQEPQIKELLANADIISYRSYITPHFGWWERKVDIDIFDRNNLTMSTIYGCVSSDGIEELTVSDKMIIIERERAKYL